MKGRGGGRKEDRGRVGEGGREGLEMGEGRERREEEEG